MKCQRRKEKQAQCSIAGTKGDGKKTEKKHSVRKGASGLRLGLGEGRNLKPHYSALGEGKKKAMSNPKENLSDLPEKKEKGGYDEVGLSFGGGVTSHQEPVLKAVKRGERRPRANMGSKGEK